MIFGSRWAGGLVERFGACAPLVLGSLITAAGYALLGVSGNNPIFWTGFLPGLLRVGFGVMLTVTPLTRIQPSTVAEGYPLVMFAANDTRRS